MRWLLPCFMAALFIPGIAHAFAVAPSTLEVSLERGVETKQVFTVMNTGAVEQTYYLDRLSFIPTDDSGTPTFIQAEQIDEGLVHWIKFPVTEFTVPPQSRVEVPFSVVTPSTVQSGGYYAALTVSDAPHEIVASNGANIHAKTAVLLLATVQGETETKAALLDFKKRGRSVEDSVVGTFQYRVQNQGNVHVTPEGKLRLTSLFGRTLIETDPNTAGGRVLPGMTREYVVELPGAEGVLNAVQAQMRTFALGPVTATLSVSVGDEVKEMRAMYWVIPWQILCVLIIILLCLGIGYRKMHQSKE